MMRDNVVRNAYLKELKRTIRDRKIKVLTGIRQCGKTTILDMFFDELKNNGISKEHLHILKLSTFDPINKYKTPSELNDYIIQSLSDTATHYFMIDEIQECADFEKVLISAKESFVNARFYITGSNSKMLSEEIVKKLGDNCYRIEVYPLSFKEYVDFFSKYRKTPLSKYDLFEKYLEEGGMPDIVKFSETKDYIFNAIGETIIKNDILTRHPELDKNILTKIISYLSATYGKRFSIDNVLKFINKGRNQKLTGTDIAHYLDCIKESYFLLELNGPTAGKNALLSNHRGKYYVVDHSLGNYLANDLLDRGESLENIVYLQLLRFKAKNITIGRKTENSKEIDFVYDDQKGVKHFVQVTQEMNDKDTEEREFAAFDSITYAKAKEKIILTKNEYFGTLGLSYPDVKIQRLADWLLSETL